MRHMLETTVALAVSGNVSGGVVADGKSRRRPDIAIVLVAQIDDFTGAVADRVVRPGRELVLAAIDRPCVTAALGGDLEAKRGIGDDIHPRRGRHLIPVEDGDVFPSVLIESANSVEELERRRRDELRRARDPRLRMRRFGGRRDFLQTFDLLGEAPAPAHDDHARHRLKQGFAPRQTAGRRAAKTRPPGAPSFSDDDRDRFTRTTDSRADCRSWTYEVLLSLTITRSTASCFIRQ